MNEPTAPQDTDEILDAFVDYIQQQGKRPAALSEFCMAQKLELSEVKRHYKTIAALERAVWLHWFNETIEVLKNSADYNGYSARERLLSFYYTWMETIKPVRAYMKVAPAFPVFSVIDFFLGDLERAFAQYAKELVQAAAAGEEIMPRMFIQNYYDKAVWQQFLFIMNFWIKDESDEQSKTDEAIERSVNLLFELAGRNQLDSIVDFGKFLFKSRQ